MPFFEYGPDYDEDPGPDRLCNVPSCPRFGKCYHGRVHEENDRCIGPGARTRLDTRDEPPRPRGLKNYPYRVPNLTYGIILATHRVVKVRDG